MSEPFLTEDGDPFLTEDGDVWYIEEWAPELVGVFLTEDGDPFLTEDGEVWYLEVPTLSVPTDIVRSPATFTIDLCHNFNRIGEAVAGNFNGSVSHLKPGYWVLTGPEAGFTAPDLNAVDSVLVYEGDTIRYAGVVRSIPDVEAGFEREVGTSGTTVTWTGTDLFGVLALRQCWPTPATPPPWADAYDTLTGPASTVAAGYIKANIGVDAIAARRITGLTCVDPVIGTVSTWTRRLDNLAATVADICREGLISCVASMPTPGEIVYTFRSNSDYRNRFVFSDQGDLESDNRIIVRARGSAIVAAGQGELTARAFAVADSGATGLDRVETVYENTNITDAGTLQLAADAQLVLRADAVTVDAVIADEALQNIRYGTDYQVGDMLGVEINGVRHASPVTSVLFEIGPDRKRVRPLLGNAAASDLSALISDVAGVGARLDRSIA